MSITRPFDVAVQRNSIVKEKEREERKGEERSSFDILLFTTFFFKCVSHPSKFFS